MSKPLIVLKFGGSVLTSESAVFEAVSEIYRYVRQGLGVLAVVSALKGETDELLKQGRGCAERAHGRALPALVSTGEQRSAALLALAAERAGLNAELLQPYEIGLLAAGEPEDAAPVAVDAARLREALERHDVVVAPGFMALDAQGKTVLLGRGGTDLSAVFLAQALKARVRLLKDVDGVYDRDPAISPTARLYRKIAWSEAERVAHPLVQDKAIRLAAAHRLPIEVAALGAAHETVVGPVTDAPVQASAGRRLRVGVLGCGVVGGGVVERLLAEPRRFEVACILVRDLDRRASHPASRLFTRNPARLLEADIDVFVDAGCGLEPSTGLIEAFLTRGIDVVSANKQAIAQDYERWRRLARRSGASWAHSAAVGGGAPVLETAARLRNAGVASVEGVLNGTSNFVLGRCAQGASLDESVRAAQRAGFAEADPSQDLSGQDAAAKLTLISAAVFGARPSLVSCEPLTASARERESALKQVGRCWRGEDGRVHAQVRLEALAPEHFLAGAEDEENRVSFTLGEGRTVKIAGKGAGRWPTTEAVLADLYDVCRTAERRPRVAKRDPANTGEGDRAAYASGA